MLCHRFLHLFSGVQKAGRRGHRNLKRLLCTLLIFSCGFVQADDLPQEQKLKAAYLFNFTKYIDWPEPLSSELSIHICLHTSDAFFIFMKDLVRGRKVGLQHKSIQVDLANESKVCHIVYLGNDTEIAFIPNSLGALIIGGDETIAKETRTIVFFKKNKKIRFEVDLNNANIMDVKISSELLKIARIKP